MWPLFGAFCAKWSSLCSSVCYLHHFVPSTNPITSWNFCSFANYDCHVCSFTTFAFTMTSPSHPECSFSMNCCNLHEAKCHTQIDLNLRPSSLTNIDCGPNRCASCSITALSSPPTSPLPPLAREHRLASTLPALGSCQTLTVDKMSPIRAESGPCACSDSGLDHLSIRPHNRLRARVLCAASVPPLDSLYQMFAFDLTHCSSRHRAYCTVHSSLPVDSSRSLLFRSAAFSTASSSAEETMHQPKTSIIAMGRAPRLKAPRQISSSTSLHPTTLHHHLYFLYSLFLIILVFSSSGLKGKSRLLLLLLLSIGTWFALG